MTEKKTMENEMEGALGIARDWASDESCVVSHPDAGGPCEQPATVLVWELPFCEFHGAEAEAAALAELTGDAEIELDALVSAEGQRPGSNPVLLRALNDVEDPNSDARAGHERDQDSALRAAYPPLEGRADPTVTSFDYEAEYSGDGPVDWWAETRYLLCRFLREAQGKGLSELEPLREWASAQLVQAEDDYEARYAAPRRESSNGTHGCLRAGVLRGFGSFCCQVGVARVGCGHRSRASRDATPNIRTPKKRTKRLQSPILGGPGVLPP